MTGVEQNVVTLAGVVVTLAGVVAWILKSAGPALLKQYRDDVFELQARSAAVLQAAIIEFRAENKLRDERHDRELTRRDAALDKLTAVVDRLADQVGALEARTDDHRPVK